MTPEELRAELDAGVLRSAYLIVGEEPLLRDDAASEIRSAVLADGPMDFDYDRLDGDRTTPAALLNAVATLPVVAQRRLVVLREPETQRGRAAALTEAVREALDGLGSASDSVFVVIAAKVDGRAKWVKAFDAAAVVRCDPPRGGRRALEAFIRDEAKRQGIAIDKPAVALLAERVGPQLLMLRQEIAKALLFAAPGEKVTAEQVAASTCDVAEEPIWDLTDAIGEARLRDALEILSKLLHAGSAPPAVLGALATHFRKLLRIRSGATVPGPPFAVRKLEGQSKRFTPGRLISCLRHIHRTDLALKGAGGLPSDIALERLVIGLSG